MVKSIVLDGRKEYMTGSKALKANGTNICRAANYTPKENERPERINRTIKNAIGTMLLHSGSVAKHLGRMILVIC